MTSRAARNVEALRCQMDQADTESEYLAVRDDYEAAWSRAVAQETRRVEACATAQARGRVIRMDDFHAYIAGGCGAELAARLAREDF